MAKYFEDPDADMVKVKRYKRRRQPVVGKNIPNLKQWLTECAYVEEIDRIECSSRNDSWTVYFENGEEGCERPVDQWSKEEMRFHLKLQPKLRKYADVFFDESITGELLLKLDEQCLREMGITENVDIQLFKTLIKHAQDAIQNS